MRKDNDRNPRKQSVSGDALNNLSRRSFGEGGSDSADGGRANGVLVENETVQSDSVMISDPCAPKMSISTFANILRVSATVGLVKQLDLYGARTYRHSAKD